MERVRVLLGTWRGRLFLVNLALFVYVSWRSQSLFLPDTATLIAVGAKDPVRLAAGEWWRLATPVFIHVGVIHFGLNSYVLNRVAAQLETVLGGPWFIAIYLIAGIAGNVASAVFSANLSAGASGAIFGLMGAGLFLELSIGAKVRALTGQRPPRGAYLTTVAMNLALGFTLPFVDNTAHLGGLFAGFVLAFCMVNVRENNLSARRPALGYAAILALSGLLVCGGIFGSSKPHARALLARAAEKADSPRDGIFYLSQALKVDPEAYELVIDRARLLFKIGEPKYGLADVEYALQFPPAAPLARKLSDELIGSGKLHEGAEVRKLLPQP
jgi:rhomboid protease GluP